jgi:glyoxylase-like metal-dependent hydrolase (beta-lactamase superfamily II)
MLKVISFTFNPVAENTYVLYNDEKDCCIIDPGCYFTPEREELKTGIEKTGLKPVLLLNTHCHLDHVFGNKFVHETWGLELHIHSLEKKLLEYAPISGEQWGLPFEPYAGPLHYLEPGKNIRIGKDELQVFFTPGHSPGSLSFYQEGENGEPGFIIGGDVLFQQSIGRTDLPGGDFETLAKSIRETFYTLPEDTVVYSGHGPATSVGFEKKNNPFVSV